MRTGEREYTAEDISTCHTCNAGPRSATCWRPATGGGGSPGGSPGYGTSCRDSGASFENSKKICGLWPLRFSGRGPSHPVLVRSDPGGGWGGACS